MALSGPLKLRLDYRLFVLSDDHDQSLYRLPTNIPNASRSDSRWPSEPGGLRASGFDVRSEAHPTAAC